MGSREITESRIETAMQRLDDAVQDILNRPSQGSLLVDEVQSNPSELEDLRAENQRLRQELLELSAAYEGMKQASERVSGRLDKSIQSISLMLEQ